MANNKNEESTDKTCVVSGETLKFKIAQAGEIPPTIVLLEGPKDFIGNQWPITKSEMIVGRSPECDIHIGDASLSRNHAKFQISGSDVMIVDLESTNRTAINGQVITSNVPTKLSNNSQIKVGNIIFKFLEQGNIETLSQQDTYKRSVTDALTGIFNKGALTAKGKELFDKSVSTQYPFTIIVFDLDFFKKVNDTYGHSAGDYVLKELSSLVQAKLIRGNDCFGRFGGEEFVLILYGITLKQGIEIAERLRNTIETHKFVFENNTIPVTISCGVSSRSQETPSWESLFERADQASYVSKKGGRNKVSSL